MISGYRKPFVHPDLPLPNVVFRLWSVTEELQYPTVKMVWVGGKLPLKYGYYIPALISYRPGIQHRLAVDFTGEKGKFASHNRKCSAKCADLGIEYMVIKRDATRTEMLHEIKGMIDQLRLHTEYIPNGNQ